jgi:hypothetical protein
MWPARRALLLPWPDLIVLDLMSLCSCVTNSDERYRFLSELSSRLIVLAILSLSASTLLAQGDALRACWILVGLGAGVGVLTAARARRE